MWWHWQGNDPDPKLVDFMKKNYPSDWTYADFASHFRAELFSENKFLYFVLTIDNYFLLLDPNDWADIFAASGAKYVRYIDFPTFVVILFLLYLDMLFLLARLACIQYHVLINFF